MVGGMGYDLTTLNQRTRPIIGAAIKVHRVLGPGLLESVYAKCLAHELRKAHLSIVTEMVLPVRYEGVHLDCGFRLDIIAMDEVILEIKSVKKLAPIHEAQLLTYLRLTGYPAGLLLNFNVPLLKQGIKRVLNPRPDRRFLHPGES
jgi:GxxExxY protein